MSVRGFYDSLAPWYHIVYQDWEASISRQAEVLQGLITEEWGATPNLILDAAAGVGTQALGLAGRGHTLVGSDIAPIAVRRARAEAHRRNVRLRCLVADLRALPMRDYSFDAVIACDNALPHLLTEDEITTALSELRRCLRGGGGCLVSLRDYGTPPEAGTVETKDYGERTWQGQPCRLRQVWRWQGAVYEMAFELVAKTSSAVLLRTPQTKYFAVPVDRIVALMRGVGFTRVRRVDGRFFQPVVVGTR